MSSNVTSIISVELDERDMRRLYEFERLHRQLELLRVLRESDDIDTWHSAFQEMRTIGRTDEAAVGRLRRAISGHSTAVEIRDMTQAADNLARQIVLTLANARGRQVGAGVALEEKWGAENGD